MSVISPTPSTALVAFLATASIGAVWSACGQDYGASGAASRFAQLEPTILVAADGYRWNGRVTTAAPKSPNFAGTAHRPHNRARTRSRPSRRDGPRNVGPGTT